MSFLNNLLVTLALLISTTPVVADNQFILKTKPIGASSPTERAPSITTQLGDNITFYAGNRFILLISQQRQYYSLILYESSDNKLVQIFPNHSSDEKRLPIGQYQPLTINEENVWFTVTPPYGKEKFWLVSSDIPIDKFRHLGKKIGVYTQYDKGFSEFKANTLDKLVPPHMNYHSTHVRILTKAD